MAEELPMETFKRCLRFLDEASPLRRAIVVPMIQILHHLFFLFAVSRLSTYPRRISYFFIMCVTIIVKPNRHVVALTRMTILCAPWRRGTSWSKESIDTMAEWLTRLIRNQLGPSRAGSSPVSVGTGYLFMCIRSFLFLLIR